MNDSKSWISSHKALLIVLAIGLVCVIGFVAVFSNAGTDTELVRHGIDEVPERDDDEVIGETLSNLRKPAIYLYPEVDTKANVTLSFSNGGITHSVPEYQNGWYVLAHSDGSIDDLQGDGVDYPYLFWEGNCDIDFDTSYGWCVKKSDLCELFADVLPKYGLSDRETHDFEIYWLPILEEIDNKYVRISFDTDSYEQCVSLNVTPNPDTIIRLYMVATGSDTCINMIEPIIETPSRNGFTVVAWGGSIVL